MDRQHIFHAYHWTDLGVNYETAGGPTYQFEFHHNDVLTDFDCLIQESDTIVCATTAAEMNALDGNGYLFASDNVNIDPSPIDAEGELLSAAGLRRRIGPVVVVAWNSGFLGDHRQDKLFADRREFVIGEIHAMGRHTDRGELAPYPCGLGRGPRQGRHSCEVDCTDGRDHRCTPDIRRAGRTVP